MRRALAKAFFLMLLASPGWADDPPEAEAAWPPPIDRFDSGKLLGTSGVSQVEGSAGAGLTPWAVIAGYGTRDAIGAKAHYTFIGVQDFQFQSAGMALGLFDRVELSFARLSVDTMDTGARLGLGKGYRFEQDVLGLKVRLFGDPIYDQDTLFPQVALGVQYKMNRNAPVVRAIGAKRDRDADFYVAATKLLLDHNLILNGTLRFTRANQVGFLGFGGDRNDDYNPQFEASFGYLFTRQLIAGAEFRMKPDNLRFAREDHAYNIYMAYFLNKNAALTLAYVDFGDIVGRPRQNGVYASLQIGF
jgi:hypothetical protein